MPSTKTEPVEKTAPVETAETVELPDVNVLVALVHQDHVHHDLAHRWLASVRRFATTPITEADLLRLALNARVVGEAPASTAAKPPPNPVTRVTMVSRRRFVRRPAVTFGRLP